MLTLDDRGFGAMKKNTGIFAGEGLQVLGGIAQVAVLFSIAFSVAIPVILVILQLAVGLLGVSTETLDLTGEVFQPSIFVAAVLCAVVLASWDKTVRSDCRLKEQERTRILLMFLTERHNLVLPDDVEQFQRDLDGYQTEASRALEIHRTIQSILPRKE